jgi:DNA-binding protein Fis
MYDYVQEAPDDCTQNAESDVSKCWRNYVEDLKGHEGNDHANGIVACLMSCCLQVVLGRRRKNQPRINTDNADKKNADNRLSMHQSENFLSALSALIRG